MKNNYEIIVNIINTKPTQNLLNNFNYTVDQIINRILEGGELIEK